MAFRCNRWILVVHKLRFPPIKKLKHLLDPWAYNIWPELGTMTFAPHLLCFGVATERIIFSNCNKYIQIYKSHGRGMVSITINAPGFPLLLTNFKYWVHKLVKKVFQLFGLDSRIVGDSLRRERLQIILTRPLNIQMTIVVAQFLK